LFPAGLKVIPGQVKFLSLFDNRECKYVAYRGGIGSGKSWIGAHYSIEKAARNPHVRGLIAANTYTQLWQTTLSSLYEVAANYGVPIRPTSPESAAKKKVLYLWNQVEVLCRAAENQGYKTWDGFKVGWFWLDEPKDMDEAAYRTARERHRDNRVDVLEGWLTSSPVGLNWFGDVEDDPKVRVVTADSRENHFLPDDYVEDLLAIMSPDMAAQQIEGKVINIYSGNCYPNFSRNENMDELTLSDDREIIIGVDFNTNPGMHAYPMQFDGDDVYVLSEIYLKGGDTPALAKEIECQFGTGDVVIHPDAAGGQRHSTGTSDFAILKEYGFKLQGRRKNPAIKDRVNAVNGRILNAKGERHLFIDKSCKLLRNDLERCTWPTLLSASYSGPLTHPGAAIGYAIEYRFPMNVKGFAVGLPKVF
ncbi:MAG TPA: terminase family protein, partial [Blastocatellia bacterium]|nr:terminase family protein [Blastocatellia bacterium]